MISVISGLSLKQSFNRVKLKPHTTPGLLFKTKIILKMDNLYNLTPICITVRTSHLYHGTKKHIKKKIQKTLPMVREVDAILECVTERARKAEYVNPLQCSPASDTPLILYAARQYLALP